MTFKLLAIATVTFIGNVAATNTSQAPVKLEEEVLVACTADAKICPDGTGVGRDPSKGCSFYPCPTVGCPEDLKICPDGTGVGRDPSKGCSFYPCPSVCKDIDNKDKCREHGGKGCRWLYGEKVCVHEDDRECDNLGKKANCKGFKKCKWMKGKCLPVIPKGKCPPPRPDKKCKPKNRPVKCGDCAYKNACSAVAAGFDRKQCTRVCRSDRDCRKGKGEMCYNGQCKLKPDCTKVVCRRIRCPIGYKLVKKPGECCESCVKQDTCPQPKPVPCYLIHRPVVCGNNCTYGNDCVARAAGFKDDQCKPDCANAVCHRIKCRAGHKLEKKPGECCESCVKEECPEPGSGACPRILKPVICGNNCTYSNDCLAKNAGFHPDEQCKPDCSRTKCPLIKCADGFKPGKKPGECCNSCIKIEPKCPEPKSGPCPKILRPVICGKNCRYSNDCLAKLAGYNPSQCKRDCSRIKCRQIKCPAGHKLGKKPGECCDSCIKIDTCPKPGNVACPEIFQPIVCSNNCTYDNDCYAKAARFSPDQCRPDCSRVPCPLVRCAPGYRAIKKPGECCHSTCVKIDTCPTPSSKAGCPKVYRPLVCGDNCSYDNECFAKAARFSPDQCKPDCSSMVCPQIKCAAGYKPGKKDGECCNSCIKIEPDCSKRLCPQIKCAPGYKAVKKPGECCYTDCVKEKPCFKPDCRTVFCAKPQCEKNEVEFTRPGECCPTCVRPVYCKGLCPAPNCGHDEVPIKQPDQCCATCVKKCLVK